MRHFGGFGLAFLVATGMFGQTGISHSPVVTSGFGNLSHPGQGAPIRPYRNPAGYPGSPVVAAPVYAYPVYVGAYGYLGSSYDAYGQDYSTSSAPATPAPQDQPAQPSMTIVYPPQQTIIINQYPSPDGGPPVVTMQQGPPGAYGPQMPPAARRQPTPPPQEDTESASDTPHYLIAFKDHSVYSAVAYWVDGDTLHYFTTGDTHNQASLSLVDRELTERLNKEAGVDLKLPPPAAAK